MPVGGACQRNGSRLDEGAGRRHHIVLAAALPSPRRAVPSPCSGSPPGPCSARAQEGRALGIGLHVGEVRTDDCVNVLNGSKLACACFNRSGRTLFVNLFGRARFDEDPVDGMRCAVTGPWRHGPFVIR
jgi:hypothetical protein